MRYQAVSISYDAKVTKRSPYYLTREVDDTVNRLAAKGWLVVGMTTNLVDERFVHVVLFGKEEK